MKKKAVIIRISYEARTRLKRKAFYQGYPSMYSYVEELSKVSLKKLSTGDDKK